MARRTKKAIKRIRSWPAGVEFVDLPVARKLKVFEVDYTRGQFKIDADAAKGVVVKLVVTYREGDDVRDDVAGLVEVLKQHAAHVRPPEYHVVKQRRRSVDDGFGKGMTMREQAEAFIVARPPSQASAQDVMRRISGLLEKADAGGQPERTAVHPFTIERVVVEGFMPFRDRQEVVLGDGVHAVVGLNRAGKSSLLDAIEFALTGKTGRKPRSNDKYVHHDSDAASVQLDLDIGGEPFVIVRRIDAKGSTSVDVTGCKGGKVSEAEEAIRLALGVDREDLLFTCLVRQRDLGGLLGQTSAPMQDALFRWLGVGAWVDAEKLAKSEADVLQRRLVVVTDKLTDVERRLEMPVPSEQEVDDLRVALDDSRDRDRAVKEATEALEEAEERLDLFDESRDLPRIEKLLAEQTEKVEKLEAEWEGLRDKAAGLKKDHDDARVVAREGFDGACPVDGCGCPRTAEINDGVDHLKAAEQAAHKKYVAAQEPAGEARTMMVKASDRRAEVQAAYDEVTKAASLFKKGTKRATLVKQVEKCQARIGKSVGENLDPDEARVEYEDALAARAQYKRELKDKADHEREQEDLRAELAIAQYVKLLCSRQGVPAMIVEGAAGMIEQAANDTLGRLGAPHRLEFSFETETKKPASVCRECGADFPRTAKVKECGSCGAARGREVKHELAPWIGEGDGGHDYAMDSGGGQDLVALAVRVALSRFLGAVLLLVDEACANLDDVNVAAFTSMIARLEDAGFEQVLVSSHRGEVKESTESRLLVERDGGASTVMVEG